MSVRKRRFVKTLVASAALALVVGGCGDSSDTKKRDASAQSDVSSVTQSQFDSVETGDAREDVEDELGKPDFVNDSDVTIAGENKKMSCLTYRRSSQGSAFQFCFVDGELSSKKAY